VVPGAPSCFVDKISNGNKPWFASYYDNVPATIRQSPRSGQPSIGTLLRSGAGHLEHAGAPPDGLDMERYQADAFRYARRRALEAPPVLMALGPTHSVQTDRLDKLVRPPTDNGLSNHNRTSSRGAAGGRAVNLEGVD
jgi:hypothetical protein